MRQCTLRGCHKKHKSRGYCDTHYLRVKRGWPEALLNAPLGYVYVPLEVMLERFWSKVHKNTSTGCWDWLSSLSIGGYGRLAYKAMGVNYAHRFSWLIHGNKIPSGLQIDHLCRNRKCVNPDHMEVVSSRENTIRGENFCALQVRQTHCKWGHPFDQSNTYINPFNGERHCRECARINGRRFRQRRALANKAQ